MISIVLSTDAAGLTYNATLLASILRRTVSPVAVRIYTRGFAPASFSSGRLSVEFIRCDEPVEGTYPRHVRPAVFDRLRIIRDFSDWDRALVLDHDMVVLCDLAEYFTVDLKDNLLAGRLFGEGNTLGFQLAGRGGLPDKWQHCSSYPYFYMGPMMNLAAMREEGTWSRLLEAHAAIGFDEQISLTAATGGRIVEVGKKWNLVPQWDDLGDKAARLPVAGEGFEDGIRWKNRVPEGIIHWTGAKKPWHYESTVWRADLWDAERTSWEELRTGAWEKPYAIEIDPQDLAVTRALVRRGWRVTVVSDHAPTEDHQPGEAANMPHPDLDWMLPAPGVRNTLLRERASQAELIRFGPDSEASAHLAGLPELPCYLVLQGPVDAEEIARLRDLGYLFEARILRKAWPAGGAHPKVLEYEMREEALAVRYDETAYLSLSGIDVPKSDSREGASIPGNNLHELSPEFREFLEEGLLGLLPQPRQILQLGVGPSSEILSTVYPSARILTVEHDVEQYLRVRSRYTNASNIELHHVPLDSVLPWYDLGDLELSAKFDLILISGPGSRFPSGMREASVSLAGKLAVEGVVMIEDTVPGSAIDHTSPWTNRGLGLLQEGETFAVLRRVLAEEPPVPEAKTNDSDFGSLAELSYVISLPEREDRRKALGDNWDRMGLSPLIIPGVALGPSEVLWQEMKGMEAYGAFERLRGDYVPTAVGCKRAGIKTLKAFLESGKTTALICQDDCRWIERAPRLIGKALAELPQDWDLLYFSASAREKHEPFSAHLVRLRGARLCTAILWTRAAAERLLPDLEACDCEWDLFMQRSHEVLNAYCVVPMPAYQARSKSDIAGEVTKPSNC